MYLDVRTEAGELHEWLCRVIRCKSAGLSTFACGRLRCQLRSLSLRYALKCYASTSPPRRRSAQYNRNPRPSACCKLDRLHQQQPDGRR